MTASPILSLCLCPQLFKNINTKPYGSNIVAIM